LLRPASLLAPLYGSDRIAPAIGDFYVWAFDRSVALPAARYDYNSDWTPLLAGLSPAGIAASFAANALLFRPSPGSYGMLGRNGGAQLGCGLVGIEVRRAQP
jgi:hypothetical protein